MRSVARYVVVNIPSAAVEAVENGEVARRYVAVVGKPDRHSAKDVIAGWEQPTSSSVA